VPLSEHEQRQLEQIERALYSEDPKFAHAVRATDPQVHYKRRLIKAVLGFVLGVCLLMAGVITKLIPISVVGFLIMLGCCVWGLTCWKRISGGEPAETGKSGTGRRARKAGFMERMEERWRRRREGDGM
jgi:hypothetical protein